MQLENLRAELRDAKHLDEELAVTRLLAASPYDEATSRRVERRAQLPASIHLRACGDRQHGRYRRQYRFAAPLVSPGRLRGNKGQTTF